MHDDRLRTSVEGLGNGIWEVAAGTARIRVRSEPTGPFRRRICLPHLGETAEQRAWIKDALRRAMAAEDMQLTLHDAATAPAGNGA